MTPFAHARTAASRGCLAVAACVLMLLTGCARCGNQPDTAGATSGVDESRVTPAELATFLDWQVELRTILREVTEEAKRDLETADPKEPVEVSTERMMARSRRNQERTRPLLAREPFKDSRKGSALNAVLHAFYVSGTFFRDEKELTRLRASYGKELIDSIADQEALFRRKLDP